MAGVLKCWIFNGSRLGMRNLLADASCAANKIYRVQCPQLSQQIIFELVEFILVRDISRLVIQKSASAVPEQS